MNENKRIHVSANGNSAPCRYCSQDDHYEGCHGKCKKFLTWKKETNECNKRRSDHLSGTGEHDYQLAGFDKYYYRSN